MPLLGGMFCAISKELLDFTKYKKMTEKSALQQARAAYQPKLPKALQGPVKVKEGEPTQSVDNQEEIKKLFPNTYGMPLVEFVQGEEQEHEPMNVGIILSGGQAHGGIPPG